MYILLKARATTLCAFLLVKFYINAFHNNINTFIIKKIQERKKNVFFLVEKTIDNLSHFTRRLKIYNLEKKYKIMFLMK